jgi:Hint domain
LSHPGAADTASDLRLPRSRDLARLRAFGPATLIETRRGPVPAIEVRNGDRLCTVDGTHAEVVWTDHLRLDAGFLRRLPQLKPVLLCEGDLGHAPLRNVVLSPEQFVWDETAAGGGGFRRAAEVTRHPAIFARRDVDVTYVSLLCGEPVVIEAEGLWISLIP